MKNNRVGDYYTPTITVSKTGHTYESIKPIKLDSVKIGKSYDKHDKYLDSINKRKQLNKNTVKVSRGINSHSHAIQFPLTEKLDNGKHRFFYKHGMLVDRLA